MSATSVLVAFGAGFVSFLAPCVLPLVPGYLSAVSGVSAAELDSAGWRRILGPSLLFVASFSTIFILLGLTATGLGSTLQDHQQLLTKLSAALIVAMGVFFVASLFVTRLNREWHVEALLDRAGKGGPIVAGAAFAIAWTPCIGPTLGAILAAAGRFGQRGGGEDRPQRRADAGGPGDREGRAGDDRAAPARPFEQGVDVPLAVEPGDEQRTDEEDAHRDDQHAGDLGQQVLVILQGRAEAGGGQPEGDEDRREAGDEEQARPQHPAPTGVVELGGGDPGDRRKVTGDERQDAGREERDDPRREGGEDADAGGGIGAEGGGDHWPQVTLTLTPCSPPETAAR